MNNPMRHFPATTLFLVCVGLLFAGGCNRSSTPESSLTAPAAEHPDEPENESARDPATTDETPAATGEATATYEFHRDKEFTEVTSELPGGSVDHINLDTDADPFVVVVVEVTAELAEDLRFKTTFSGADGFSRELFWQPADSSDDEFMAIFVVSAAAESATTVVE